MDCARIKNNLNTVIFARHLHCFDSIGSTNSYLLKLAREGAPEGTVVCAEFQDAGRGRRERIWHAASGQNLLCSVLLRPQREIQEAQKITLAAADILAATIEKFMARHNTGDLKIKLKWPNDLLIDNKKISGILAESVLQGKKIEALALGFGVNLNTPVSQMAAEIQETATSLIEYSKAPVSREDFFIFFLREFEQSYIKLERTNYANVVSNWKKRSIPMEQSINVVTADGSKKVLFHDISEAGYMVYKNEDGTLEELIAGEVQKV